MIQFKLGKFAGDFFAALCFVQIFAVCCVDPHINIQTLFGGNKIGVCHSDLCHNGNCLGITAIFFGIHLGAVCLIFGNMLREFEQIVGGADSQFHP